MKYQIKKIIKKFISGSKKLIDMNPRIGSYARRAVNVYLPRAGAQQDDYELWLKNNYPDPISLVGMKKNMSSFEYNPLISIVLPTYNTEESFLRDCLDSVQAQIYENWELCIVDDASPNQTVRDIIAEYAKDDKRIKYRFSEVNQHIAGATNDAIDMTTGEFVSLLDHDDIIWPNALYEIVKALNKDKKIDFLYTDEDKITEDRRTYRAPFFKPDWNPDFLHSVNYITHFSTIRASLLKKVGGPRKEYDGAQDWDLFLRITAATKKIHHIPTILYSWRMSDTSTAKDTDAKPYVVEAQRRALTDDLARKGHKNAVIQQDPKNRGYWMVEYPVKGKPLISIVIPTKNQYKVIKRCIESIYKKTTYKKFEIIIVDTGSTDKKVLKWYEKLTNKHKNLKIVNFNETPFSYAKSSNYGAQQAKGELLVMLNNDTEIITRNWLELMAGDAQREEIGSVGCLLYFPDRIHIQHAGIGIGLGGVAANLFSMVVNVNLPPNQHLYLNTKHDVSAVTGACMMMRANVYKEVGGFDEEFRVTYNDVDLGLRLLKAGYLNLYTPHVEILHHESISVGMPSENKKRDTKEFIEAKALFIKKWKKYIQHDPYLNPNIKKSNAFLEVDGEKKI